MRATAWLIPIPAFLLALASPAFAEDELRASLSYTVYDNWTGQGNAYNAAPPLPPTTPIIATGTVAAINHDWGGGAILDSGISEDAVIKYEGWLLPDEPQTLYLCAYTDDGFILELDGETAINDWWDRGPSCGNTADVDFNDGEAAELVAWYYENGGGAVAKLLYYTGSGWEVVPDGWYHSDDPTTPTTTTTSTTTTTTTTSTTTTTPEQKQEQERREEDRKAYEKTAECEKVQHAFESCPLWPGRSTTTSEAATTTAPATTAPTTTLPATTAPETTAPAPTTSSAPEPATTMPSPTTAAPSTTAPPDKAPLATPQPAEPPNQPAPAPEPPDPSPPLVAQPLDSLEPEQLENLIAAVEEGITPEEATALVAALNESSPAVKQQFEQEINVFSGLFDDYEQAWQNVTVAERRTLIAAANAIQAASVLMVRRRR